MKSLPGDSRGADEAGIAAELGEVDRGPLSGNGKGVFAHDAAGRRPFNGDNPLLQTDLHWRDHLLFHEFFHGETGQGLGAAHQTGWTGLVAQLIQQQAGGVPAGMGITLPGQPQERRGRRKMPERR